jgi:hypothetical protein
MHDYSHFDAASFCLLLNCVYCCLLYISYLNDDILLVIMYKTSIWPWDGHYKSILLPADEEIMGSL